MVYKVVDIILIVCYAFVFLSGTVGNGFVIRWFGRKGERRKAGNKLVVMLAINDLLSSVLVPLSQIHYLISASINPPGVWYLGKVLCYSLPGIGRTFLYATSFYLIAISLERYR